MVDGVLPCRAEGRDIGHVVPVPYAGVLHHQRDVVPSERNRADAEVIRCPDSFLRSPESVIPICDNIVSFRALYNFGRV